MPVEPTTPPTANLTNIPPEGGATPPAGAEVNWQERFESQQKINRDLERRAKEEYASVGGKAAVEEARLLREELAGIKAKAEGREAEFAAEQKAREVESAALAKANERILKAEVRAAAAGKLADPKDALKFLDLSVFEVGADGDVDAAAVMAAVEKLVNDKPYLAAVPKGAKPRADKSQGGGQGDTTASVAAGRSLYAEHHPAKK